MKHPVPVAILILLLASGCGKVGDPRPPKIRVPAPIMDLKVTQSETNVVLTWTNPQKYIDGSNATDLTTVQILRDGKPVASPPVSGPGKPQSHSLNVSDAFGTTPSYTVVVQTERGKPSGVSNEAHIEVVDVPGVVSNLKGSMDQHRIHLEWDPPVQNPSFAETYLVRRVDGAIPPVSVSATSWDDMNVEAGKTYSYVVTAGRGTSSPVYGRPAPPYPVVALDKAKPAIPKGLQPPTVSDTGANLIWDKNAEDDIEGYKIYRSDNPDTGWVQLGDIQMITQFTDAGYRPGFFYRVSAVDDSLNESDKTQPVRAP